MSSQALSFHRKLVKDPENDLSQLNRLDGLTFFLLISDFSHSLLRLFGATVSVLLLSRPGSNNFQTTSPFPLRSNWELATEN
jgi:hypothetical protein